MNNQELKRELNRMQVIVLGLGGGILMFICAMQLLLLDIAGSTGSTLQSPETLMIMTALGVIFAGFGLAYPCLAWTWDWYRDRQTVDGGAA